MDQDKIRNFCIIAHIDHGKSTLADRFLELTKTVSKKDMKEQILDQMDLERERGITIKLQPVRMNWKGYELNLIDTPGHVDFTYEVSRSLAAVEGAILLVDATQGVQAQTLTNLHLAKKQDLVIVSVINKIDLLSAETERVTSEIESILGIKREEIILASAKTGKNIKEIIERIIDKVPSPKGIKDKPSRALIFDSFFDPYRGVIVYVQVVDGKFKTEEEIEFLSSGKKSGILELGYLNPKMNKTPSLNTGEIGYIITGLKSVQDARVGDTVVSSKPKDQSVKVEALPGYKQIKPFVFASFFTTDGKPNNLKDALEKLQLNDSSLVFESEKLSVLGMGFRCGFLGFLHMDIVKERLSREYNLDLIITSPSVTYRLTTSDLKEKIINNPSELPDPSQVKEIKEPYVKLEIITPSNYVGPVMDLIQNSRGKYKDLKYLDEKTALIDYEIPLSEVIIDLFDRLKEVSSGYASFNYEFLELRTEDLVKMDFLIAGDKIDPLSIIVPKEKAYSIGRDIIARLREVIPRQMFKVSLQAAISGKIIAREDVPAYRKDVTAKLYGGDYTRKRKLLEKQKKGKKRLKKFGKVDIPQEAFLAVLKRK